MSDALVITLANLGYQTIFLPGTGYVPPDLYTYLPRKSSKIPARLVRHGSLSGYLEGDKKVDFTVRPNIMSSIEGVHTSNKTSGGSLDFLSKTLACIGVPALPRAKIGIDLGKTIAFSFDGVTAKSVDPSQIEKVLDKLALKGIPVEQIENGDVHIAYEYLYATKLLMARKDAGKFTGDVAGKIGDWVNLGSAKVNIQVRNQTTISFEVGKGKEAPPAFAYKAGQVVPENGAFALRVEVVKAGATADEKELYVPHPDHPLIVKNARD